MPNVAPQRLEGGHAICLTGYDDSKQFFKFRNSWGVGWGDKGNGYLPYAYVTNSALSSDFWVITTVKDDLPPPPKPTSYSGTYTSSSQLPSGTVLTLR